MGERRGNRAALNTEDPRDLFLIKVEVVISHDHGSLPGCEHPKKASDLGPVECVRELVAVRCSQYGTKSFHGSPAQPGTTTPKCDAEQPAREVHILLWWALQSLEEGVVSRVERSFAVPKDDDECSIDAGELLAVELLPSLCARWWHLYRTMRWSAGDV